LYYQSLRLSKKRSENVPYSATINPAIYLNATDSLGTIEQGNIADLVLLNKNPLEDISYKQEIDAVVTSGQYLKRKDLDSHLNRLL
jgi:imidazolonepropionase-like amidohydrolase